MGDAGVMFSATGAGMNAIIAQVVAALIAVESNGNSSAIGDGGRAVGVLQMWECAVAEANRLEAIEARREKRQARTWTLSDRRVPERAVAMAWVTLRAHYRRGVTDPVELGCRWRNPYSECPAWYRAKVRKELGRTQQ
jgi:hypothetical protein